MDLTTIPADASEDDIRALILHDKTVGPAIDLTDVIDIEHRRNENLMRRREKMVVSRWALVRDENGPRDVRLYLQRMEDGSFKETELPHEAATWMDIDDAHGYALRARRDLGGDWRAVPTRELGSKRGWPPLPAGAPLSL